MTTFEAHGIVELMGHARIAGKLSEVTLFGSALMRVDVPKTSRREAFTKYYSAGAIYCITPTDEATAQAAAERFDEPPVQPYILPMPASPALAAKVRIADDGDDGWHDPADDGYDDWRDPDEDEELPKDRHLSHEDGLIGQSHKTYQWGDEDDYYPDHKADKLKAAKQAKELVEGTFVLFDTETTGFENTDEIISIAIIDDEGLVLLDEYIRPVQPITNSQYHGITDDIVKDKSGFPDLYTRVRALLDGKIVLAYNYAYDGRMLDQVCKRHDLPVIVPLQTACVMELFAAFYGEWNDYRANYRWQKLAFAVDYFKQEFVGSEHHAVSDAQMALLVLEQMAAWYDEQQKEPVEATDAAS